MSEIIDRRASADAAWGVVDARPAKQLAPLVRRYTSWRDARSATMGRMRHGPSVDIPLIVDFAGTLGSVDRASGIASHSPGFVAGMHHSYAVTEANGPTAGVQIDLTPIGAHLLLRVPMDELTDRAVALEDVIGPEGQRFIEQVRDAGSDDERFARIDRLIAARLADARVPPRAMFWAWNMLESSGGRASIAAIGDGTGWSRKHLVAQFRAHIGVAPKTLARIIRFNRATGAIRGAARPNFGVIAADAGYYDQAHMIREFIEFAGATPRDYVSRRVPDSGDVRDA